MVHTDFAFDREKEEKSPFPCCMHEGCREAGRYKAPAGPDRLRDYLWFCLEHVRAYNANWNYHRGMSRAEIEAEQRRTYFWDRPTWRLGSGPGARAHQREQEARDFAGSTKDGYRRDRRQQPRRAQSEEEKALDTLGLGFKACFDEIRRRYRDLAKQLHPDATGGDKSAEERLKRVTQAYATLKRLNA